ncbi:nitroreductase/quinone reductase family protein [Kribbia dieselivorans]|uniref:nitroreductase/quinone reductase family protein n=1 Tax=Kribbia dieselivorans TaxID=331526 RepID=UPI001C3F163A|nr:nitroreductase/quinone reductase family protein [Kribbia dieselivorans]
MLLSDDMARWMYRGAGPNAVARVLNGLWSKIGASGVTRGVVTRLEVRGRTSGDPVTFPLMPVRVDGEFYLVAMLGERAQWVKNVRAADGHAVLISGRRRPVHLVEVPSSQRAPIIKAFLRRAPGGRPHIPVDKEAPLADFEPIAYQIPVFRVTSPE